MVQNFAVRSLDQGDVACMHLYGELDLMGESVFEQEIEKLLESGAGKIIIDLRGLSFMDSTGIRLLLNADQMARQSGPKEVAIVPGGSEVMRVVQLTGIDKRLDLKAEHECPYVQASPAGLTRAEATTGSSMGRRFSSVAGISGF